MLRDTLHTYKLTPDISPSVGHSLACAGKHGKRGDIDTSAVCARSANNGPFWSGDMCEDVCVCVCSDG